MCGHCRRHGKRCLKIGDQLSAAAAAAAEEPILATRFVHILSPLLALSLSPSPGLFLQIHQSRGDGACMAYVFRLRCSCSTHSVIADAPNRLLCTRKSLLDGGVTEMCVKLAPNKWTKYTRTHCLQSTQTHTHTHGGQSETNGDGDNRWWLWHSAPHSSSS